jgi:hypothetical protein
MHVRGSLCTCLQKRPPRPLPLTPPSQAMTRKLRPCRFLIDPLVYRKGIDGSISEMDGRERVSFRDTPLESGLRETPTTKRRPRLTNQMDDTKEMCTYAFPFVLSSSLGFAVTFPAPGGLPLLFVSLTICTLTSVSLTSSVVSSCSVSFFSTS